MDNEMKMAISLEIAELSEKVKNKQGQINHCSSLLENNLDIPYLQNNVRVCKLLSLYIDEYIILCSELIKTKKEL